MATGTTAIRAPTDDLKNHTIVLRQLKEIAEVGQRLRGDPTDSFVKVSDLVGAGIARFVNNQVLAPLDDDSGGGGGTVTTADSVQGDGSSGSPIQLVGDASSPGNTMLYGTNGTGVKGWYAQPTGGGGSANVTPDTHPTSPTLWDDEFEATTLNPKWVSMNIGASVQTLKFGSLIMTGNGGTGVNISGIGQSLTGAGSTWEFRCKCAVSNFTSGQATGCMFLRNSVNGRIILFGISYNSSSGQLIVQNFNSYTSFSSNVSILAVGAPVSAVYDSVWGYYAVGFDGTNIYFSYSTNGVVFIKLVTVTPGAFLGTPTDIALGIDSGTTPAPFMTYDWFRKTL